MTFLMLIAAIVAGVVGQLLLKSGMSRRPDFRIGDVLVLIRDLPVVAGFLAYGISTLLYLKVLAELDLSLAYPTVSLGYVLVILMSKILFNEPVSSTRWVATVVICAGVVMVGLGSV